MENFQLFIYIIIGVIYLFYRSRKKEKGQSQQKSALPSPVPTPQNTYKTTENKPPNISFTKPASQTNQTQKPTKEELLMALNKKRAALGVENIAIPVENYEDKPVEKYVDRLVDKNVEKKVESVNPYALDQTIANPYTQFLKTPEGIKAAFIAAEIMQRKYE